jgi:hypothetical protein
MLSYLSLIHIWKKCDRVWIIWGQKLQLFIMIVSVHVKLFAKILVWKGWMNIVVLPQLCIKVLQAFSSSACVQKINLKSGTSMILDGDMWIMWTKFAAFVFRWKQPKSWLWRWRLQFKLEAIQKGHHRCIKSRDKSKVQQGLPSS